MKHTKGPWYPSFQATICIGVQNSPDGFTQMICNSILPDTDEAYEQEREEIEANMKLIAAAPDLLGALEECVIALQKIANSDSNVPIFLEKSRQAIKKATL